MPFCNNCGANLPEGATFCSSCGTPVQGAAPQQPNNFNAQQPNTFTAQPMTDEEDIKQNKVYAVLAYIGILVLIPLFAAKNSKFARYHAKQGLLVLVPAIAYSICTLIINAIVGAIFQPTTYLWYTVPNPVASIISIILGLASLVFVALEIVGIVNAAQGKYKEIPVLGKLTYLDSFFNK